MAKREEIEEVLEWCRKKRKEAKVTPIIEGNPFKEKFFWLYNKLEIAIDLPLEQAKPNMLLYDSTIDSLLININNNWLRVEADDIFEV
jgi:hypothetical protein